MQILEDLYVGAGRPSERYFQKNSQYAKALGEVVKVGDQLTESLNAEQKHLFEDFMDAQREVTVLKDCVTFAWPLSSARKL